MNLEFDVPRERHLLWKNWYLARFDAEDGR